MNEYECEKNEWESERERERKGDPLAQNERHVYQHTLIIYAYTQSHLSFVVL